MKDRAEALRITASEKNGSRSLPPHARRRRAEALGDVELPDPPVQDPRSMPLTRLPFATLAWKPGPHPLEKKKLVAGQPVVMLEFAPGFEDPNWCERGHVILVLDGTLEIVLDDRSERFAAGDACVLDPGTRHRARNPGSAPVRLFVVSS